jgi:hypothetical protein
LIGFLYALGLAVIPVGIRFRLGHARGAARYYENDVYPVWARNAAFGLVPSGLSLLCLATALVLFELEYEGAGLLVSGLFLLFGVLSIILTLSPPRWAKPAWLRSSSGRGGNMWSH